MSTNIDGPFIPDENLLQELANGLFKENPYAPGIPVAGQYPPANDSPTDPRYLAGFRSYPSSLHDSYFKGGSLRPSLGGAGISPGAYNHINEIDLRNQNELLKGQPYPAENNIPHSVAGSGISPSAHHQGNEVNLQDPQTSLPDPHFPEESHVPSSLAGSGASPSV